MFWSKKDTSKAKKTLLQCILQNILKNQTFQRIVKFIMVDFYEMNFMKAIGSKSRWDVQYLASQCLLVKRWRWSWMTKVFAGVCPWISIRLLCPSFIKGEASSCKGYSCIERVWYCNIDDTGARYFGDPKKYKWTKKVTFNKNL